MSEPFRSDEAYAHHLDAEDPLRRFRDQFHFPLREDGSPLLYFCGHSLGLQPRGVRPLVEQELDHWARLGVEGHFQGAAPWYHYHELFRDSGARLVGAVPGEVVMMNSLTVNLHLMLATFFQPSGRRRKILIDSPTFPSDLFAVQTHLRQRGLDPVNDLLIASPRPGELLLRQEDIAARLQQHGSEIAVVLWNPVNYFTGQLFDTEKLTTLANAQGCVVGLDLAHAAGNVVLRLHDWQVDFAVWCNYKYLNAGPGAVGACFVHEKHGNNASLPRLAGWWGTDPATRFQLEDSSFVPRLGADGWQISNPPILALAPLRASLALFDQATMPALRAKSERLTSYLYQLLDSLSATVLRIVTPADPRERGAQLSIQASGGGRQLLEALQARGVLCDFRAPDILRLAPVPLYNSFHDVWMFSKALAEVIGS